MFCVPRKHLRGGLDWAAKTKIKQTSHWSILSFCSYFWVKFSVPRRLCEIECRGPHTDYLFHISILPLAFLMALECLEYTIIGGWAIVWSLRLVSLLIFLFPLPLLFVDEVFSAKKQMNAVECRGHQSFYLPRPPPFAKMKNPSIGRKQIIPKLQY